MPSWKQIEEQTVLFDGKLSVFQGRVSAALKWYYLHYPCFFFLSSKLSVLLKFVNRSKVGSYGDG